MNIEKLKPWNWFKHEDDSTKQVPVSKQESLDEGSSMKATSVAQKNPAMGSLLHLHNEMDRLFDDIWRSFDLLTGSRLMRPMSMLNQRWNDRSMLGDYRAKLDVSGSEKAYEISIELPGLSEEDVEIELDQNTLIIKGQIEEKNESSEKQYYRVERNIGSFQRTLSLPNDADRDGISASMRNGLLVIQIPRKAMPNESVKRISVSSCS